MSKNCCCCCSHPFDIVRSYYKENLDSKCENHEILGWESKEAQFKRFSILTQNVNLEGLSILDVGCGLGDLNSFLKQIPLKTFSYHGIDITHVLLERARLCHPEVEFSEMDLIDNPNLLSGKKYDVVYSSGVFNLNTGNNIEYLEKALGVFAETATKFVVFNLLSHKSNQKDDTYFYYFPDQVKEIASQYSFQSIEIIEEYLLNDFTVICKKNGEI